MIMKAVSKVFPTSSIACHKIISGGVCISMRRCLGIKSHSIPSLPSY